MKSEVARFEQERIQDFKDSLQAFLEGMVSRQKEVGRSVAVVPAIGSSYCSQLISSWEAYQHLLLKRVGGGGPTAAPVIQVAEAST